MNNCTVLLCCLVFLCCIRLGIGIRTKEKIYVDLDGYHACFRRFNATHQIGCSTGRKGNVGIIHYIENQTDVDWVVNTGPHSPYLVLLTPRMFTKEVVNQLDSSDKINGMLVIHTNDSESPLQFSPDSTCPNEHLDLYSSDPDYAHCKNTTWNPAGNDLFFGDHDFPIVALTNSTEVEDLINNCYKRYNEPLSNGEYRSYPLCVAEVKSAMDGAVDTPTCIRRSNTMTNLNPQTYCDSLGDYNVYGFMQPSSKTTMNRSLIIAATRLDSFSMFDNLYPSVDNPISGIVTLLAAAEALGKVKDDFINVTNPLMFAFYNGEAFDYMGSSRILYNMENNKFPKHADSDGGPAAITPENIRTFYEISQVGIHVDPNQLFMHTDPLSRRDPDIDTEVNNLITQISNIASEVSMTIADTPQVQPLPPASLQTFLKKVNITGLVISNHQAQFTNKYYNSMYDKAANIGASYPDNIPEDEKYNHVTEAAAALTKLATVTARTLYEQSTGLTNSTSIVANETVMANLLYCFTYTPICELFNHTLAPADSKNINNNSLNYYVGVSGPGINWVTHITSNLLSFYLSDNVTLIPEQCSSFDNYEKCCEELDAHKNDKFYTYKYISGPLENATDGSTDRVGQCIKSSVFDEDSTSPAFEVDDYNWESNLYPAWTESRWATNAIFVRYFLVPPLDMEITLLVCSLALFGVMMFVAYLIEKKAKLLFAPSQNALLPNENGSDASDMAVYGTNTPTPRNNDNEVHPVNV